jgi:NAD(P)-dependent dehydrogenase (short-subunit alcohol dehydrogenase family)
MARVLVTGSTDGLGRAAAAALLQDGHDVVVHGRSQERLEALRDLTTAGAQAVVGDLSDLAATFDLVEQVNALRPLDAVIHNAGVMTGSDVLAVNVVAPYVLTAGLPRPARLVYLSSAMHRGGRARVAGLDGTGTRATASYSDSKLLVTALAAAVARRWPQVLSNAVDPGWVPTRMGGPGAPDDLRLGHVTQVWLATSTDAAAQVSGGYWRHQHQQQPHATVHDEAFQDLLLEALAEHTGLALH